jgi:glyoxylase-like metal-dependent hydrolase (beta-lactamase superfamily II)
MPNVVTYPAEKMIETEGTLKIGNFEFEVFHTPGHSPGSISFYTKGMLFCGDTLFDGSIGRTDLPGGDYATLIHSIKTKLFTLPKETVVYPGHGESTTIDREQKFNPFLS